MSSVVSRSSVFAPASAYATGSHGVVMRRSRSPQNNLERQAQLP